LAIAAPAFSPHDPELVNLSQKYAQPDAEYPLGTDFPRTPMTAIAMIREGKAINTSQSIVMKWSAFFPRCTLSRLLYGARYSIGISLPVLLILSVIGLIVGTFSACTFAINSPIQGREAKKQVLQSQLQSQ